MMHVALALLAMTACSTEAKSSSSSSSTDTKKSTTTTAASARLYPGRPDAQKKDHEAALGQPVELSGYTVSVSGEFKQQISEFERDGYIVLNVAIANRDKKAQSYNPLNFRLQGPSGSVEDMTFTSVENQLHSGDLVPGGSVTGTIVFEAKQKGDYYVLWKPDAFDASRGVWKVTVS